MGKLMETCGSYGKLWLVMVSYEVMMVSYEETHGNMWSFPKSHGGNPQAFHPSRTMGSFSINQPTIGVPHAWKSPEKHEERPSFMFDNIRTTLMPI